MSAAGRLRLQMAFRNTERNRVGYVGHSVGLTFNLAIGACKPVRLKPRKRRLSGGYQVLRSKFDIFAFATDWQLWRITGYCLRSQDCSTRIRRELERLKRKKIVSMSLIGSMPRLIVVFQDHTRLDLLGDIGDEEDPYGWNVTGLPGLKSEILSLLD